MKLEASLIMYWEQTTYCVCVCVRMTPGTIQYCPQLISAFEIWTHRENIHMEASIIIETHNKYVLCCTRPYNHSQSVGNDAETMRVYARHESTPKNEKKKGWLLNFSEKLKKTKKTTTRTSMEQIKWINNFYDFHWHGIPPRSTHHNPKPMELLFKKKNNSHDSIGR